VDWPALYRSVERDASLGAVRFRAAYTDGGMVGLHPHFVSGVTSKIQIQSCRHRSGSSSHAGARKQTWQHCMSTHIDG
jgi:hypothetical protein